MKLGAITYDANGNPVDDGSTPAPAASDTTSNLINIASGLVSAIQPYKSGVPVNFAISPQTQNFLMMGGLLVAGLVILSMARKR